MHGVPTPANALVQDVAREFAASAREPGSVPVEWLLGRLGGEGALKEP
jgi:hypothetical protein